MVLLYLGISNHHDSALLLVEVVGLYRPHNVMSPTICCRRRHVTACEVFAQVSLHVPNLVVGVILYSIEACSKDALWSFSIWLMITSSSDTSAGQRFPPHNRTLGVGEFRVGGGAHDSYTFQCGLVGSFTSPGIDTR